MNDHGLFIFYLLSINRSEYPLEKTALAKPQSDFLIYEGIRVKKRRMAKPSGIPLPLDRCHILSVAIQYQTIRREKNLPVVPTHVISHVCTCDTIWSYRFAHFYFFFIRRNKIYNLRIWSVCRSYPKKILFFFVCFLFVCLFRIRMGFVQSIREKMPWFYSNPFRFC